LICPTSHRFLSFCWQKATLVARKLFSSVISKRISGERINKNSFDFSRNPSATLNSPHVDTALFKERWLKYDLFTVLHRSLVFGSVSRDSALLSLVPHFSNRNLSCERRLVCSVLRAAIQSDARRS